jgi:phage shock protein A
MGLFSRISDLLSANINSLLDQAEDPEKMANEYIRQLNNELTETKSRVAAAMADETKLAARAQSAQAEADSWSAKAEAALRAGDEELAKAALQRKVQSQKLAEEYRAQHEQQATQVNEMQELLVQMETKLAEMKAKKELIIAKKNRAATQEALSRTARSTSSSSAMNKLDQLEEKVDDQLATAQAMAELEGDNLEKKFADLEKASEVDDELAELKRKMGLA